MTVGFDKKKQKKYIMKNYYTCQHCSEEKEETHFETDLFSQIDTEEMTCESCYDEMDNL